MSVLVVAEQRRGAVREVTYELVAAAAALPGPVMLAVVGGDAGALELGRAGVDELVHVPVAAGEFESDTHAQALELLVRELAPQVVLLGFTVDSMAFAPGVAAKLGLGFASDVFALAWRDRALGATRAFYGGKVHAEVEFPPGAAVVLLLRAAAWPQAEPAPAPPVRELRLEERPSRTRHEAFVEPPRGDLDITKSDFLLAVGRGIGDRENLERFERLAERLGATLAVSRPLVDAGWAPSSRQVGQSGNTVKPKVYLACGISGAVQHLAGMKASGTIIAVNKDPDAAIFDAADYGAVADILELAEEFEKLA